MRSMCVDAGGYNPVDGWIAKPSSKIKGSYKIFYCPEFEKDNGEQKPLDKDAVVRLMCGVAKYAADEYRDVLKWIMRSRQLSRTWKGALRDSEFVQDYQDAISLRKILEYTLYSHYEKIQKELGFSESDVDEIVQAIDLNKMKKPRVRRWSING